MTEHNKSTGRRNAALIAVFGPFLTLTIASAAVALLAGCETGVEPVNKVQLPQPKPKKQLATATFGGGCFWCTEAVYQQFKGVESVVSGYAGGPLANPTYREVCSGTTGHAEVIQVTYDPEVLSYTELLEVFWQSHDPTTLNRQGADVGTQYRSIILYHDDQQKQLAEAARERLNAADAFGAPVVTEITAATEFYPAETVHQDYFQSNGRQPYCAGIIQPKVDKIRKVFAAQVHPLDN